MEIAALLRLASDQRLAEHVNAGSERAFEVLYDRHHRGVLSFCRHMLGSHEEAEDALQHTFMAAYRDLRRSGPPAAVRPWLFVIARNRCISVLRARREHPAADVPERVTDHLATEVAAREELRAVLAAMARLPEDQRAALVLTELGDVSHDEIARILDCRREQVKSYVYQARATLATDRVAREMPCSDIRAQLADMRAGQLRRAPLRRHLHDCVGCREFRETLRVQRKRLGLLLPVVPSLGLKRAVLGATLGGGSAGGLSLGGVAATAVLVVAIPAGTAAVANGSGEPAPNPAAARTSAPVASASPAAMPARTHRSESRRAEQAPRKPGSRTADKAPAGVRAHDRDEPRTAPHEETSAPAQTPAATPSAADPSAAERSDSNKPASPPGKPEALPGHSEAESPPDRERSQSAPGRERSPSAPGRERWQSAPGRERSQSAPGRERSQSAPGRETSQSAPGRERSQSAPGQNQQHPGPPAPPPGQGNPPVTPEESKPEHAAEPGPPAAPPEQAGSHGPPEVHPGRGSGRG
jgi:RNA polymerase sigma factor (sigma-70 family)